MRFKADPAAGFTLVELMVVMVLIALLLTIAVPRYFRTIDNGKLSVQKQNLSAIRDAIDKFYGDQGRYPDTVAELVDKRYLRNVPIDPVTNRDDWTVIAPKDSDKTGVYDVLPPGTTPDGTADGPSPVQSSSRSFPSSALSRSSWTMSGTLNPAQSASNG